MGVWVGIFNFVGRNLLVGHLHFLTVDVSCPFLEEWGVLLTSCDPATS